MANVKDLLNRTIAEVEARGYRVWFVNNVHSNFGEGFPVEVGGTYRTIDVNETFRYNHSEKENVTVTISVSEWIKSQYGGSGERIFKIKVPANAI